METDSAGNNFYMSRTPSSAAYFQVLEARLKLVKGTDGNYCEGSLIVYNSTADNITGIKFLYDKLLLNFPTYTVEVPVDMTLWHTVKIVNGESSYVYLDGDLIGWLPNATAGGIDLIGTGSYKTNSTDGSVWLDYIKYGDASVSSTTVMTTEWTADAGITVSNNDPVTITTTNTGKKGLYRIPSGTLTNDSIILSTGFGMQPTGSDVTSGWLFIYNKDSGYNVSLTINTARTAWAIEEKTALGWNTLDSGTIDSTSGRGCPVSTLALWVSIYYFVHYGELMSSGSAGTVTG